MVDQNDKTGTRGSQRQIEATTTGKERIFYNAENPGFVSDDFILSSMALEFTKIGKFPADFGEPEAEAWNYVTNQYREIQCISMVVMLMNMDDDEEGYFYYMSATSPKKRITFEWWEQKVNNCFMHFATDIPFLHLDRPPSRDCWSRYDIDGHFLGQKVRVPEAEMHRRKYLGFFREYLHTLPLVQKQRKKQL
jgi:hypothetical protein